MERRRKCVPQAIHVTKPICDPIGHLARPGIAFQRVEGVGSRSNVLAERRGGLVRGRGRIDLTVVGISPDRGRLAFHESQGRSTCPLPGQLAQTSLNRLQLAKRHHRIGGRGAGQHRHERNVQDCASRPQSYDGDVVGLGGRPELVDDRLDAGVGRDCPRQGSHDAAEALRLRVATLNLDAGGPRVHHGRRNHSGDRDRQAQFHQPTVIHEELDQPLAQEKDYRDPEQRPGEEDARGNDRVFVMPLKGPYSAHEEGTRGTGPVPQSPKGPVRLPSVSKEELRHSLGGAEYPRYPEQRPGG